MNKIRERRTLREARKEMPIKQRDKKGGSFLCPKKVL